MKENNKQKANRTKRKNMIEPVIENKNNKEEKSYLLELTSDVISSYVANNPVSTSELPGIISSVHNTFTKLAEEQQQARESKIDPVPAVPIKKSINSDFIVCLEDGKKFKSLKRHLSSHYGITPEEYREKWGLPSDYPMVAPNY
ncbi:MAG: MucR family transcriptional regulator, partial [Pseudomonadota bacterium]